MPDNSANPLPNSDSRTAIKTVEIEPGKSFTANGRKYLVADSFTIGRLERVTLMEEELSMLSDRPSSHETMLKAMEHINNYKPGEAYTLMYNKIESDRQNSKLLHFTLRACTAYINYEGEDLRYLTEQQIQEKINDWATEGLDVRPFMVFAVHVYKEFLQTYKHDILNTLSEAKSIEESLSTVMDMRNSTAENDSGPEKSSADF